MFFNLKFTLGFYIVLSQFKLYLSQSCPTLENNIDYFGSDITYAIATSVALCCARCASQAGCTSFSFVTAANLCWLKNASPTSVNRVATSGRISGFVVFASTVTTTIPTTTTTTTRIIPTTTLPPTTIPTTTTSTTTTSTTTTPTTTTTTTTIATSTLPFGCFIEYNVNYFGNDYSTSFVGSPSDCCNLCGKDTNCLVWSYLNDAQFCFLKNALPSNDQRQNYTNAISGIVVLR